MTDTDPSPPEHHVTVTTFGYDGELMLECPCGWEERFNNDTRFSITPAEVMRAQLAHEGPRKLGVLLNSNVTMSRGKATAQAIHAVLQLLGIHHEGAVIVLGGNPADITALPSVIRDAGRTEIPAGTLTAGATWLGPNERMERP